MSKIKNYLKQYKEYLTDIKMKGFIKSLSYKKPKKSALLLLNLIPYVYVNSYSLLPQNETEKKNALYHKLRKENNIKFSLISNIKICLAIIVTVIIAIVLMFHVYFSFFALDFMNKTGMSFNELRQEFITDAYINKEAIEIEFNQNTKELTSFANKNFYVFNDKKEVDFDTFKNEYFQFIHKTEYDHKEDFPTNGSNEDIIKFQNISFDEEYKNNNYKFFHVNEKDNKLFEIKDENDVQILNKKFLKNFDLFNKFDQKLNSYHNFNDINRIYIKKEGGSLFIINKTERDEGGYSYLIVDYSKMETNNTISNFLYKGYVTTNLSAKGIGVTNDYLEIISIDNQLEFEDFVTIQKELVEKINFVLYFYLAFLSLFILYITSIKPYLKREIKRREDIVFSSENNKEFLSIEHQNKNKKFEKVNKNIAVINL